MDFEEARLLYDTSAQLIAAVTPEEVLRAISLLGPPGKAGITLFTVESDEHGQPQWLRIAAQADQSAARRHVPGQRLDLPAAPLAALCMRHPDSAQLVGDIGTDPRVDLAIRAECRANGVAAFVVLPLTLGGRWIGFFSMDWSTPQVFSPRDERLLGAMLKQAAMMMEHRMLLMQTQSTLDEHLRQKIELQAILEAVPIGIVVADARTGVIQLANQAAVALLGRGIDPDRGKDEYAEVYRLYHPGKDTAMDNSEIPLVMAMGGQRARKDVDIVRPAGSRITVDAFAAPLLDEAGQVMNAVVSFQDVTEMRERQSLLETLVDNSPSEIFAKDPAGRYLFINRKCERFLNKRRQEVLGKTDNEIWPKPLAASGISHGQQVHDNGQQATYEESALDAQGTEHIFHKVKFPLFDGAGKVVAICGIATDITEAKRIASERLALQQQVIDAQSAELQELSTPLIPLAAGVVVMPLVGSIDNTRAEQIMIALLDGITKQRAHLVIVDITGVRTVDTHVASALIRAARSAKLLGAKVVLTGIGAAVAQTLVHLGVDLGDIITLSNLQSGIQYALKNSRFGNG